MTPNERQMLSVFQNEVEVANRFTMSKRLSCSVEFAENLLKRLTDKEFLVKEQGGKYPTYRLKEKD